ncbi:DUF6177 family protein [Streptomyces sp. B6B3]|uniref:DUF6177 family protein n=1 Tax=Streptomyces sp. B6B3 TaxID=3153570 RepID=UPI00325F6F2B
MTTDVIALTERMPDAWSLVAGLASGGADTRVATAPGTEDAVIQLLDSEGRPLVSVEAPMLVHAAGEAERLLGVRVPAPVWWTEVRAATAVEGGAELAGTIATRLVSLLGGTVWPPDATARDGGAAVVPDVTAAARPAAAQPAVDVLTGKAVAVIQDRPVVAMTAWLADALRAATAGGRALQIVTPRGVRLTLPTRAALSGLPNRWVVRDGAGGYHDGLSGAELRWRDGAFAATGAASPAFVTATREAATCEPGHQLVLTFVTRGRAERELVLGGALESVWRRLTDASGPQAWGTAEPATLPWSRQELTDLARRRAPASTWFVAVGDPERPGIATLRVARTTGGVEEDVTLALARRAPDEGELRAVATELVAEHGLVSLLVQSRRARGDLTVPPHLETPPVPLAFVLGAEGVREVGRDRAADPPLAGTAPARVGAGLYYPLGDGGWQTFQELMGYLHAAGRSG